MCTQIVLVSTNYSEILRVNSHLDIIFALVYIISTNLPASQKISVCKHDFKTWLCDLIHFCGLIYLFAYLIPMILCKNPLRVSLGVCVTISLSAADVER